MKEKRIALIGNAQSRHLLTWAEALHGIGFKTDVFSPVESGFVFPGAFNAPRKDSRFSILYYIRLARVLRRYKNVNLQMPIFKGILLFLLPRKKVYVSILGTEVLLLPAKYPVYRFLLSKMLARAKHIIVPNGYLKEKVSSFSKRNFNSTVIIYGVDMDRFSFKSETLPKKPFRMLLPKDIRPVYGVDTMIKAFAMLQRKGFDGELIITGKSRMPEEWKQLLSECPDSSRIMFPGWVDRMEDYFKSSHATILPSRSESFGVAAIESIACGTPVIASDIGGLTSIVGESGGGILIRPEEPSAIADAVESLDKNYGDWRNKMIEASRRVRESYSVSAQLEQMRSLWKEY